MLGILVVGTLCGAGLRRSLADMLSRRFRTDFFLFRGEVFGRSLLGCLLEATRDSVVS